MARSYYFITHPDVVISRDVPITEWPLSERGRARMRAGLEQPWVRTITSVYASTERKAIDGAHILAGHLSLDFEQIPALGEIVRSSTGFLPPSEFEATADEFFARPDGSVRGWERAIDAQTRIVRAVERLAAVDRTSGAVAIVAHGAVGALLHCWLSDRAIARRYDQPATGGGNYFRFSLTPPTAHSEWLAFGGGRTLG